MEIFEKTPEAKLDYVIDWSNWLPTGYTIATSTWTVGADLTNEIDSLASPQTTILLSGGVEGVSYIVKNTITTSGGTPLIDSRVFKILVTTK